MDLETPFQFIKYFLKNDLLKKTVWESVLQHTKQSRTAFQIEARISSEIQWQKHPNVRCTEWKYRRLQWFGKKLII
jgi:hypothetical protein